MKSFLTALFLCLGFTGVTYAEYNGHFIDFDITLKNGKVIEAHCYLASLEYQVDSGSYQSYLERNPEIMLRDNYAPGDEDHFAYHEYRLTYKFQVPDYDSGVIFSIANKKSITIEEVSGIQITQMIDYTYSIIVVNSLEKKDEKWFSNEPVNYYQVGDRLNSYQVFIHETNSKLQKELIQIKAEGLQYNSRIKELEDELDAMDAYGRQEVEKQLDGVIAEQSEWVKDVLSRLSSFKVVIIGYLSC